MDPKTQINLSIVEVLQTMDDGGALGDLRERLSDVTRAVLGTNKPGSVTLTLKVEPMKNRVQVAITDSITAKVPTRDKDMKIFFTTEDGNLTRRDPSQLSLLENK